LPPSVMLEAAINGEADALVTYNIRASRVHPEGGPAPGEGGRSVTEPVDGRCGGRKGGGGGNGSRVFPEARRGDYGSRDDEVLRKAPNVRPQPEDAIRQG
ncbi:MAG: hypothetical protein ACLPND_12620, partial [Candidatus Korobacteraceae bacterium]